MKRNSNKNKKNTVIITIKNDIKKQNLIKCGGWVVYAETVTCIYIYIYIYIYTCIGNRKL